MRKLIHNAFDSIFNAPLIGTKVELKINILESWEIKPDVGHHFSQVTDTPITHDNLMNRSEAREQTDYRE